MDYVLANIWLILCSKPSKFWIVQSNQMQVESAAVMLHLLLPALFCHWCPEHTIVHFASAPVTATIYYVCTTPCHCILFLHHPPALPVRLSSPATHGTWYHPAEPLPPMAAWHCISSHECVLLVLVAAHSPAAPMPCLKPISFSFDFTAITDVSPKEMASMNIKPSSPTSPKAIDVDG